MDDVRPGGRRVPVIRKTIGGAVMIAVTVALAAGALPRRATAQDIRRIQDREGYLDAVKAIAEGREHEGAAQIEAIIKRYADDPDIYMAYYNLACAHARLGETEQALALLEKAYDLGYGVTPGRLQRIPRDPDLASVRETAAFKQLLEKMVARYNEIQRMWPVERKAAVRLPHLPAPSATGEGGAAGSSPAEVRRPLLVVLHGYGDYKSAFIDRWFAALADSLGAIVMAPTGYVLIAPEHYGWFTSLGDYQANFRTDQRNVWIELQRVLQEYPVDPERVYIIGLGQGATLAYTIGLRNPQKFAGVLAISGRYIKETLRGGWLGVSGGYHLPVVLVEGRLASDEMVEQARNARDLLAESGVNVRYEEVEGEGGMPADAPEMLADLVGWLMGQKKARYSPPVDFGAEDDDGDPDHRPPAGAD